MTEVSGPRRASGHGPWGALWQGDAVCFRLWAPSAERVDVVLDRAGEPQHFALRAGEEGWFGTILKGVEAGTRYGFSVNGAPPVPDPAARFQPEGVKALSEVINPGTYRWREDGWRGRPWHEAVIYELHVGTFSPQGTYAGVIDRLPELAELGITAIELMPVAAFSGTRGWGYDGVLPFAPHAPYGRPDELKRLVDTAHAHGLMVLLDVVYNHFGPDGNVLHGLVPAFFDPTRNTPWGAAIDFSRRPVRDFFIQNALYWLEEFRFDGLRLDAVHAIHDESPVPILHEMSDAVAARPGQDRQIHLVLENGDNAARYLGRDGQGHPRHYTAQWNDDIHHAFHVCLTGETDGYYTDYAARPAALLGRCLAQGFAYQGERSTFSGHKRGEPSGHLPPAAFIGFLQNHDQIGNRAMGERLDELAPPEAIEAALAILLLSPHPPMLFMGEEWGAREPFLFFCDFDGGLADAVREGRRQEFAAFPQFSDEAARARIPDPNAVDTFTRSTLTWSHRGEPAHARRLDLVRRLLRIRHRCITPQMAHLITPALAWAHTAPAGLRLSWSLDESQVLTLMTNLQACPGPISGAAPTAPCLFTTHPDHPLTEPKHETVMAPAWFTAWFLQPHPSTHD